MWVTPSIDILNSCTQTSEIPLTVSFPDPGSDFLRPNLLPSTCYPADFSAHQYHAQSYYSPGVCPYNYQYIATSVESGEGEESMTLAICCPYGIDLWTDLVVWTCAQITNRVPNPGLLPSKAFVSTVYPIPGSTHHFVTTRPQLTLQAAPISVAWRMSDLSRFTPASAPVLDLVRAGATITPAQTSKPAFSTVSSTKKSSSHHGPSLDTGAAVGIGVGITLAAIVIIVALLCITKRCRRRRAEESEEIPAEAQVETLSPSKQEIEAVEAAYDSQLAISNNRAGERISERRGLQDAYFETDQLSPKRETGRHRAQPVEQSRESHEMSVSASIQDTQRVGSPYSDRPLESSFQPKKDGTANNSSRQSSDRGSASVPGDKRAANAVRGKQSDSEDDNRSVELARARGFSNPSRSSDSGSAVPSEIDGYMMQGSKVPAKSYQVLRKWPSNLPQGEVEPLRAGQPLEADSRSRSELDGNRAWVPELESGWLPSEAESNVRRE